MGKIIMITGGMRSGKSSYAEALLDNETSILYIATSTITDADMEERVRLHQARRGDKYKTFEGFKGIEEEIREAAKKKIKATLFECVGTFVTNLIFDKYMDIDDLSVEEINQLEGTILDELKNIIRQMKTTDMTHVIITNEVGLALISEYRLGRVFTDILGRANQLIAKEADQVYMIVSGYPITIKN